MTGTQDRSSVGGITFRLNDEFVSLVEQHAQQLPYQDRARLLLAVRTNQAMKVGEILEQMHAWTPPDAQHVVNELRKSDGTINLVGAIRLVEKAEQHLLITRLRQEWKRWLGEFLTCALGFDG